VADRESGRSKTEARLRQAAHAYVEHQRHLGNMGPTITGMFLLDHIPEHRELSDAAIAFALARISSKSLIVFVINYIRDAFDHNDDGPQAAYFEVLDICDDEIADMLSLFLRRKRWAGYPGFPAQLDNAREARDAEAGQ